MLRTSQSSFDIEIQSATLWYLLFNYTQLDLPILYDIYTYNIVSSEHVARYTAIDLFSTAIVFLYPFCTKKSLAIALFPRRAVCGTRALRVHSAVSIAPSSLAPHMGERNWQSPAPPSSESGTKPDQVGKRYRITSTTLFSLSACKQQMNMHLNIQPFSAWAGPGLCVC